MVTHKQTSDAPNPYFVIIHIDSLKRRYFDEKPAIPMGNFHFSLDFGEQGHKLRNNIWLTPNSKNIVVRCARWYLRAMRSVARMRENRLANRYPALFLFIPLCADTSHFFRSSSLATRVGLVQATFLKALGFRFWMEAYRMKAMIRIIFVCCIVLYILYFIYFTIDTAKYFNCS